MSFVRIIFFGKASNKVIKKFDIDTSVTTSLLELANQFEIPIASSCAGRGQCQKCVANDGNQLLCCVSPSRLKPGETYQYDIDYL